MHHHSRKEHNKQHSNKQREKRKKKQKICFFFSSFFPFSFSLTVVTVVFRLDRQPDFKKSLRGVSVTVKTSPSAIEGVSRFAYRQKTSTLRCRCTSFHSSSTSRSPVGAGPLQGVAINCRPATKQETRSTPDFTSRFKSRLFCLSSVFYAIQRNVIASTSTFLQTLKPPAPKNKDKDF